jgi:phosphodiesterase/alkaline phosphatase D-like protein
MMQGNISVKSVIFVVVVLLVIVLGVLGISTAKTYLSSAAGGSEPVGVKSDTTEKSATISWTTDKPTLSRIQYGTTPVSMLLQSDLADAAEPKLEHEVVINSLKSGQTYYFRIKTGEDLYDNGGIPFSFKTA